MSIKCICICTCIGGRVSSVISWSVNSICSALFQLQLQLHSLSVTPIGRIRGIPAFDSVRCTRFLYLPDASASGIFLADQLGCCCCGFCFSTLFYLFIYFFYPIGPRRTLPHLNPFLHLLLLFFQPLCYFFCCNSFILPLWWPLFFPQLASTSTALIRNDRCLWMGILSLGEYPSWTRDL